MNDGLEAFGIMHSLAIKAKAEKKRKDACPIYQQEKKAALEQWYDREAIRHDIKGLGRNEICPTHGLKVKKCGCMKAAQAQIIFDGEIQH